MNQKQETTERGTAEQKTGVGVDVWQILEARERETNHHRSYKIRYSFPGNNINNVIYLYCA
jgi:hypothetical protein